jgi:type II secretory pathway pseudopilin PulG
MTYTPRQAQPGFSIIELMTYITIAGLLLATALFLVPYIYNFVYTQKTQTNLHLIKTSLQMYYTRKGSYPENLSTLVSAGIITKKDSERAFKDAWDSQFQYKPTPQGAHPYELYSYGSGGPGSPKEERLSAWE